MLMHQELIPERPYKRCPGCPRPVCQRVLSTDNSCDRRITGKIPKKLQPLTLEPVNEYRMYDYTGGGA